MTGRALAWGDLENAWDLGGLPTAAGSTRRGQVFRSMKPDALDARGWEDVIRSGVTTIVDLRNDDEVVTETLRPESLAVQRRAVEDQADGEFMAEWGDRLGSPAYYSEVLRRWPGLIAAAIGAIADAPGPVLIHCSAGRDRTGMISAMIEQLVGVDRAAILDDYSAAVRAFNVWKRSHPIHEPSQADDELDRHLERALRELSEFLDGTDVEAYLRRAGVKQEQLDRLRSRLLDGGEATSSR